MFVLTSPSEIAFKLNGFPIYYYGICLAMAVLCGFYLSYFIAKREYKELNTDILYDVITVALIGGILFARLYYCVVNFEYYSQHLLEILNLRQGGLSIHGGIIGGVLFGGIYVYIKKYQILKIADIFAYGLLFAQAIGRWGNFFNSEAYGLPSHSFIGVFIPELHRVAGYESYKYFHPTFLYESLWNFFVFCILFFVIRKFLPQKDGVIFFSYLLLYSIGRFFIEQCRLDSVLNIGEMPVAELVSVLIILSAFSGLFFVYRSRKIQDKNL